MCCGVVPQHPPTILTPYCTNFLAYEAIYSGEHRYMFRPSMLLGLPAFGWTDSFLDVTSAIRSMASSIGCGPTPQLSPTTSAPQSSRRFAKTSGGVPSRLFPSSSIDICTPTALLLTPL